MESEWTPEQREKQRLALLAIAHRCEQSGWSSHIVLRHIATLLPKLMPVSVATEAITRLQMVTLPPHDVSGRAMADAALAAVREWTEEPNA